MAADISILQQIQAIMTRLNSSSGRMARFSYTQAAFDNREIEGVASYDFSKDQNIPLSSSTDTNDTVLNKGFRAQGASIPRNLQNHFFGRASFNINMLSEQFNALLSWLFSFIPSVPVEYSSLVTYFPGNIAFLIEAIGSESVITWYERTGADPGGSVGVPPTDPTRWRILRERTSLSRKITAGSNLDTYIYTGLYSCISGSDSVSGMPETEAGAFLLSVQSDKEEQSVITQEIVYRDTGRGYCRTLVVTPSGVTTVVPWFKSKEPGWSVAEYPKVSVHTNTPTSGEPGGARGVYKLKIEWVDFDGNVKSVITDNLVGPPGPSGAIANIASQSENGLMSSVDKTRLDNVYQAVTSVAVGTPTATTVPITTAKANGGTGDSLNIPSAVTGKAGLLSSADKAHLDSIQEGAQVNPGLATSVANGLMSNTQKIKMDTLAKPATLVIGFTPDCDVMVPSSNAHIAINAALATLPVGGGTVVFREGTYNLGDAIVLPGNCDGYLFDGLGGAGLKLDKNKTTMFDFNTNNGCTLQNMSFIAVYNANEGKINTAITISDSVRTTIKNCSIAGQITHGAVTTGIAKGIQVSSSSYDTVIEGCRIASPFAIDVDESDRVTIKDCTLTGKVEIQNSNYTTIRDCNITSGNAIGIYLYESMYASVLNCKVNSSTTAIYLSNDNDKTIIKNNRITACRYGIYNENGYYVIVEGNHLTMNPSASYSPVGIYAGDAVGNKVIHNTVQGSSFSGNDFIGLTWSCMEGMVVDGNTFGGFATNATYKAIEAYGSMYGSIIANNSFGGSGGTAWIGIHFRSDSYNNNKIIGNTFKGVMATTNTRWSGIATYQGATIENLVISGNTFLLTKTNSSIEPQGIVLVAHANAKDIVISGNTISFTMPGPGTTSGGIGISIGKTDGLVIEGNSIRVSSYGDWITCIYVATTVTGCTIAGNILYSKGNVEGTVLGVASPSAVITGNTMKSIGGYESNAVSLHGAGIVFSGNTLVAETGEGDSVIISLYSKDITVSDNNISVTSAQKDLVSCLQVSGTAVNCKIAHNTISVNLTHATLGSAVALKLQSSGATNKTHIDGNTITVTVACDNNNGDNGKGKAIEAGNNREVVASNNIIKVEAYSPVAIESSARTVMVGNEITCTSTGTVGLAVLLSLGAHYSKLSSNVIELDIAQVPSSAKSSCITAQNCDNVTISDNSLSGNGPEIYGVNTVGCSNISVLGNSIRIIATTGNAYGVMLDGYGTVYGTVSTNSIVAVGSDSTTGVHVVGARKSICNNRIQVVTLSNGDVFGICGSNSAGTLVEGNTISGTTNEIANGKGIAFTSSPTLNMCANNIALVFAEGSVNDITLSNCQEAIVTNNTLSSKVCAPLQRSVCLYLGDLIESFTVNGNFFGGYGHMENISLGKVGVYIHKSANRGIISGNLFALLYPADIAVWAVAGHTNIQLHTNNMKQGSNIVYSTDGFTATSLPGSISSSGAFGSVSGHAGYNMV